ncbi:hypothetical protein [Streptomyces varsoviensis]|uniref:Uncharacterized protein n=1 Tax=Streptomyces varsoviensis TaxID=67373 RepID=A0ABR5IXI5_9ACTN|nr:hypothetical protein [Streptomyces varsoviensis]KOG85843.1 hypothetical protein ADK38_34400 [Streptomyces varsoviensis]
MAGEAWLRVPVYVGGLRRFPQDDAAFKDAYGKITDAAEHKKIMAAVKDARKFLEGYGDPAALTKKIAQDGEYLQKKSPPGEFYAQALWAAYRAQSTAGMFVAGAKTLRETLAKQPEEIKKNAALVRDVFTGSGGLASMSAERKDDFTKLALTAEQMVMTFEVAQKPLADSMGTDSKTYASAKAARKECENQAAAFDGAAEAAWTEWLGYRGAQPAQPLDVCVVNCGVPVGAAKLDGQAPTDKAVVARTTYTSLQDALGKADDEVGYKACLAADLAGFERQAKSLPGSLAGLRQRAADMSDAWNKVSTALHSAAALADDVLGDPARLDDALDLAAGAKEWDKFAAAAKEFTEYALVAPTFAPWGLPLSSK